MQPTLMWNAETIQAEEFTCGYCHRQVASTDGWPAWLPHTSYTTIGAVVICPNCTRPSFVMGNVQVPGPAFGDTVSGIDEPGVAELYDEARRCVAADAFTAAVLACRKLLMHVAVSKGAEPGKPFVTYVEHLATRGYVPPDAKEWVDHIRRRSNEANHEIELMSREDAEELISFSAMLLQLVYEFPAAMRKKVAATAAKK